MDAREKTPWREVPPVPDVNGDVAQVLASVDALKRAWEDVVGSASQAEFSEARERSLRRHAIETGIIERLYDVEWGVTEALVAEGLTAEVAAREGGLDESALAIIQSQFDGLTFLAAAARNGQPLTLHFIRELHALICRQQRTYEARNSLGQVLQLPLHHGAWKDHPNHVVRQDGSLLEYVPPEQVQSQMEFLIGHFEESGAVHPVVRASWLHHAFICIHPFEDGNGRVARALTLLVLLQQNYAPLVVDRLTRADYISALDRANDGNLQDLVRLFSRLEIVALRSELERPARPIASGAGAIDVARSYVERLRALRETRDVDRTRHAHLLARDLQQRVDSYLNELGNSLQAQFRSVDGSSSVAVYSAAPGDERANYWRAQIIRAANKADFFVNLSEGTWWSQLRLDALGQRLRYVAVIQKVGHGETGVLALTIFAETLSTTEEGPDLRPLPTALLGATDAETATFVYSDVAAERWDEVAGVLDRTLAAAVAEYAQGLD